MLASTALAPDLACSAFIRTTGRAGTTSPLALNTKNKAQGDEPVHQPCGRAEEDTGRAEELITLTSTWNLRINILFYSLLFYYYYTVILHTSFYYTVNLHTTSWWCFWIFWITEDYQGLHTAGRSPWNRATCSLPSSAEIPRPGESVQPLCPPQPPPSRKGCWAGCRKLPGISPISLAANLTLLLELIIFSWWQSTGVDWTVCLVWERLNSWKDAQRQRV